MLNKNANHLFLFVVTVQFHIAHLYEIQVSLFSLPFFYFTLFPRTQVFLSFVIQFDCILKKRKATLLKSPGKALLFCRSSFWTRCRQNLGGSREREWVGIGDYSELIIGVATETRKSCLPPLLYSGGLVFSSCQFQWSSTVVLLFSGIHGSIQLMLVCLF